MLQMCCCFCPDEAGQEGVCQAARQVHQTLLRHPVEVAPLWHYHDGQCRALEEKLSLTTHSACQPRRWNRIAVGEPTYERQLQTAQRVHSSRFRGLESLPDPPKLHIYLLASMVYSPRT